jgi:hypothetical protein
MRCCELCLHTIISAENLWRPWLPWPHPRLFMPFPQLSLTHIATPLPSLPAGRPLLPRFRAVRLRGGVPRGVNKLRRGADNNHKPPFPLYLCDISKGDRRGSNPRPSEPQSDALPTELRPPGAHEILPGKVGYRLGFSPPIPGTRSSCRLSCLHPQS